MQHVQRRAFNHLNYKGVECRPIISEILHPNRFEKKSIKEKLFAMQTL